MRLLIARCTVDYNGRLDAHLPEAVRLIMVKADGSVMVHADGGAYKPLNWMNPPNRIIESTGLEGRVAVPSRPTRFLHGLAQGTVGVVGSDATVLSELLTTDDGADLEFDLLTGPTAPLSVAPATGAVGGAGAHARQVPSGLWHRRPAGIVIGHRPCVDVPQGQQRRWTGLDQRRTEARLRVAGRF